MILHKKYDIVKDQFLSEKIREIGNNTKMNSRNKISAKNASNQ